MKRGNYFYAKKITLHLEKKTTVKHMNSRLLIHYCKEILLVVDNQSKQGMQQIEQVIGTFQYTGETSYADELSSFAAKFIN